MPFNHLFEHLLENMQVSRVEVGEEVGADQVPGEVSGEGDGGVADPADLAVRRVRDHKVLLVQPRRDVGGRQRHGCDKKTEPVEVDRQTEGKIVSFTLLHRESCFQPAVFPDPAVEATTSSPNLKRKRLGHLTKFLEATQTF